jgi:predicted component of type VI protein secretion system
MKNSYSTLLTLMAFFLILSSTGCIGSSTLRDEFEGNTIKVNLQRSPEESLNDFKEYLQSHNFDIKSINEESLKTSPGILSIVPNSGNRQAANTNQPEVRIKAVATSTENGSKMLVIAQYLNPSSGDWKQAYTDYGGFGNYTSRESMSASYSQAFQSLRRFVVQRYGDENVDAVETDTQY